MLVHISNLKIGDKLTADVFNHYGLHVLSGGTSIDVQELDKLNMHQIDYVEIAYRSEEDASFGEMSPYTENLYRSHQPRFDQAVNGIKSLFEQVSSEGKIDPSVVEESFEPLVEILQHESDVVSLLLTLNSKDDYTYAHSVQVGMLCYYLSKWLGSSEEEALYASKAGFLHDIGKSKIDEAILKKPGRLTDDEYHIMKTHTVLGEDILLQSMGYSPISLVALQHHERMNGTGYPYRITGDRMHPLSKICAVSDIYSAMISSRVYQKKRDLLVVLRELHNLSFADLDPAITLTFIRHMLPNFIGKRVSFKDGDTGYIVMIHPTELFRPLVRINETFIDLSTQQRKEIEMIYM